MDALLVPQLEVLRKLQQNIYLLTPEERSALSDVINHFDSCIVMINLQQEPDNGYLNPLHRPQAVHPQRQDQCRYSDQGHAHPPSGAQLRRSAAQEDQALYLQDRAGHVGTRVVSGVKTLEQLFEFMAEKINAANDEKITEQERAQLIGDAAYEAAFFLLQTAPTNQNHQFWLAADLVKRLRNFKSPYLIISREMADARGLRRIFDNFIETTEGWDQTHH